MATWRRATHDRAASSTTRRRCGGSTASGMLAAVAALPARLREGWAQHARASTLPAAHRAASSVAVLGMGGSAIGGDLVARHLRRPAARAAGGRARLRPAGLGRPADARRRELVQRRHRGDHRALASALERRCPVVGRHHRWPAPRRRPARRAAAPRLPGRRPAARGGGLLDGHPGRPARAGRHARARRRRGGRGRRGRRGRWSPSASPEVPTDAQPGQAAGLGRSSTACRSSRPAASSAPVARRWKTQLNENSKSAAVVGGAARGDPQHGRRLRPARDAARPAGRGLPGERRDHPRNGARAELSRRAAQGGRHRPPRRRPWRARAVRAGLSRHRPGRLRERLSRRRSTASTRRRSRPSGCSRPASPAGDGSD